MWTYEPGTTIQRYEVLHGRVWMQSPVTVVHDDGNTLGVRLDPGSPFQFHSHPFGAHPWSAHAAWGSRVVLQLHRTGDHYGVWKFFDPDGTFLHWYVNFEAPIVRRRDGFETDDHGLDLIVHPDGRREWKDVEDLHWQCGGTHRRVPRQRRPGGRGRRGRAAGHRQPLVAELGGMDAVNADPDICLAGPADLAYLARLLWLHAAPGEQAAQPVEQFALDLSEWWAEHADSSFAFIARHASAQPAVVGMAWLALVPRPPRPSTNARVSADIQSVYVVPEHRGRQIGSALVQAAVDHARLAGAARVTVSSGRRAVPLYERLGFTSSRRLLEMVPPSR